MAKKYNFRREDNGKIVMVSFEEMMKQQGGWITLPDGTQARRVHDESRMRKKTKEVRTGSRDIVSDSLGFGQHQLDHFESDRKAHGFDGVEFKRDPMVPEFFQVHCSSRAEFNRYVKHRGMVQKTSVGGVRLSDEELRRAEQFAKERFGCEKTITSAND